MRPMRGHRKVLGTAGVVAGVLAAPLYRQYRRDIQAARERVRNLGSHVVSTGHGSIEYLTFGQGQPVLVVHGIVGGCDQALLTARYHVGEGFLSLLPSRFGYLRTPLPAGATPASQADTYVGLLDTLGIARAAIMGISAGGTSAIQFALRHPDRCAALVLLSSNAPAKVAVPRPPEPVARVIFRSDFIFWLLLTHLHAAIDPLMGIPKGLALTPQQEDEVAEVSHGNHSTTLAALSMWPILVLLRHLSVARMGENERAGLTLARVLLSLRTITMSPLLVMRAYGMH